MKLRVGAHDISDCVVRTSFIDIIPIIDAFRLRLVGLGGDEARHADGRFDVSVLVLSFPIEELAALEDVVRLR